MHSDDEWISATSALELLKPALGAFRAERAICKRAHDGLIRARAERFTVDGALRDDTNIPKGFWWAEGEAALVQDWKVGDFETWIDHKFHLRAFGVSFYRADLEKLLPKGAAPPARGAQAKGHKEAEMDEMTWALSGLKYLRDARLARHDELNAGMEELKETANVARSESWYRVSKNVLPILYHYSSEFTSDGLIPGEIFASPEDFAVRLAGYRAFLEQMRAELDNEDAAYRKRENADGPQFLIGITQEHVEYFLKAIEHVEKQRPGAMSTGLVNDLMIATRLANRFHESVLALAKHPHGGTVFQIKDEWDSQYLFYSILRSHFSDVRREEFSPSVAGTASRCEFFLKDQRLMIELKYVHKPTDQKKIKTELLTDLADYGANSGVDYVIALVYDPASHLPDPVQLQKDIPGAAPKTLKRVQVIVSPPRS